MRLLLDDTIAALASAPGPGERGIVRLSGAEVHRLLECVFRPDNPQMWRDEPGARRHSGQFIFETGARSLPLAVYLWPGRRSYTGQPLAELHLIGSPPLLDAVLAALFAAGARPAGPGEFTLRAFLTGRIDLTQAEAVLGVVDAADSAELQTALAQLAGGVTRQVASMRGDLLDLLADLEAGLDFAEEDIEFLDRSDLICRIEGALSALDELQQRATGRMRTTGRPRVVLAGLPNAGKSTLFNCLARRPAALVSEICGTTRDYLAAEVEIGGLGVELVDTAGCETPSDPLSRHAQGIRAAQLAEADLVVWCRSADLDDGHAAADAELVHELRRQNRPLLVVQTKSDLLHAAVPAAVLPVSAVRGEGLSALSAAVARELSGGNAPVRQVLGTTAARCRDSLQAATAALVRAKDAARMGAGEELIAVELREALDGLGRILGTVYTDDILDRIFSRFCIGK